AGGELVSLGAVANAGDVGLGRGFVRPGDSEERQVVLRPGQDLPREVDRLPGWTREGAGVALEQRGEVRERVAQVLSQLPLMAVAVDREVGIEHGVLRNGGDRVGGGK